MSKIRQISTFLVLSCCYFIVICIAVLGQNFAQTLSTWGDEIQATVYLKKEITQEQSTALRNQIESDVRVQKVEYIDKKKALERFKSQISNYAPDLLGDSEIEAEIPASYVFSIKPQYKLEEQSSILNELVGKIKTIEGVEDVTFGQEWIKNFTIFLNTIHAIGGVLILVLGLAMIFVIGNTIRASLWDKKEEIEVLELIGATKFMIRKPFIRDGILISFFASFFGLGTAYLVFHFIISALKSEAGYLALAGSSTFLSPTSCAIVIFVACLLGGAGSYLCLREMNTGWLSSRKGSF